MKSTLVLAAFLMSTIAASAGGGWYIGPQAGLRINSAVDDEIKDISSLVGFSGGLNVLGDLGGNFRFDGSLLYTQRGFNVDLTGGNEDFALENLNTLNYFDIALGLNWYLLGSTGLLQPYLGVNATPGFYLGGTTTLKSGTDEESVDIESEDVESFHFALMPKIGLDLKIGSMLLGAAVGYDLGLTTANTDNGAVDEELSYTNLKHNGVAINVRLAIPLGGGSSDPEVDPMNVD